MKESRPDISLNGGVIKSLPELENDLRRELLNIGVDHATLVIQSHRNTPVFQYIDGLSSRISISKRVIEKLHSYIESPSLGKSGRLDHSPDMLIDNHIFDHERLSIIEDNLHQYGTTDSLMYNHNVILIYHSVSPVKPEDLRQLQTICDITLAWANTWVAHNTMWSHWSRYSETNTQSTSPSLTKSESDVLDLLIKGLTGSEVADIRNVSKETVRTQIKSILHKTQCRNQNQLISRFGQGQWLMNSPTKSVYT